MMMKSLFSKRFILSPRLSSTSVFALFFSLALTTGCGSEYDSVAAAGGTGCATTAALIGVFDGVLYRYCGCAEGAGTVQPPASLDCTVTSGTTVFFEFIHPRNRHQILSTGTPSFVSSPPVVPGAPPTQRISAHGVKFETVGTYTYEDAFSSQINGRIIVVP